jgi:phenylalanyl-tRNA synthetase beta chain
MNLSLNWLKDYVNIGGRTPEELAHALTMSGSKTETCKETAAELKKIVIARVDGIERHQDSEKLWVAQLNAGQFGQVQIVTAAQNVTAGAYVPAVLDGGSVIRDKKAYPIKKSKMRGAVSEGMMCSFEELGLEHSDLPYAPEDGILILNDDPDFPAEQAERDLLLGTDVRDFLKIRDHVIEFEITNNRPDCLCVLGLARETAATLNLPFAPPEPTFTGIDAPPKLTVAIETKNCSRYMAAVVKNVRIKPSPKFIAARLRACGIRPINNLVDITNYVMLEYGHPMHAFDKRFVEGDSIVVRQARDGEQITLLDGTTQTLNETIMVIADSQKPIAVAGVMGGEFSGILADTTEVVFEAACFDGVSVRKAAKQVGRRTESSARFEKGIDPINAKDALYRALELINLLDCGDPLSNVIDIDLSDKQPKKLPHDWKQINRILGADIPLETQQDIFRRLGFEVETGENGNFVTPPHIRMDVEIPADLAEEVARIYGYNEIGSTLPLLECNSTVTAYERLRDHITRVVIAEGFYECKTVSFIAPKAHEKAGITGECVTILNPLGEDTGVMRKSLLPSMLNVIGKNKRSRLAAGRFFEMGRVFFPRANVSNDSEYPTLPEEKDMLCMAAYGTGANEDFFTFKGAAENLMCACRLTAAFTAVSEQPGYHPGRRANITVNGEIVGVLGEVHPAVCEAFDIFDAKSRVYAAELDLRAIARLSADKEQKYAPLPKFPALTRDLSLVCPNETACADIVSLIQKSGKHLEQVELFDVYTGDNLPQGKKSLSFALTFRKADSTMEDTGADNIIRKILAELEKHNITIRQ